MTEKKDLPARVEKPQEMTHVQSSSAMTSLLAANVAQQQSSKRDRYLIAQANRRNEDHCMADITKACKRKGVADHAEYNITGKGSGPSIRLMEEIARHWKNFDCGTDILDMGEEQSIVEVWAEDLETMNRRSSKIVIKHLMVRKGGAIVRCESPDDVYITIASRSQRWLREMIRKIVPSWVTETALEECKETRKTAGVTEADKKKLFDGFAALGVTPEMIRGYIRKPMKELDADDLDNLRTAYATIKNEEAEITEIFTVAAQAEEEKKEKKSRGKAAKKDKSEASEQESSAQSADITSHSTDQSEETATDVTTVDEEEEGENPF